MFDAEQDKSAGEARSEIVLRRRRAVKIIALVKPFRAQAVLSALQSMEILGGTVREAMGYGRQKSRLGHYLGSEYNTSFLPKVQVTVFVDEQHGAGGDQSDR